ncbi:hypothetical protein [Bradyrhizobium sp. CCBAU 53421]|uniref:hypothetical protein n=1 Tax=Bradyrhizobium sp. CCBAU 53421 TaxID=1325120 RepID=UPI00188CEA39|nr:hypothetical protein [Bradyrhizobium sp. CCBAU 53421]QOZ33218.1 hypothetical protein XH92_17335 [Bradyrhizobium sp. CCBAU 53421]
MRMNLVFLVGMFCGVSTLAHGQSNAERYMLQERCGKRAAEVFAKEYSSPSHMTEDGERQTSNYRNHYSEKLNKCFFLEISLFTKTGKVSNLLRLYDLNENKEYASYWDTSDMSFIDCVVGETRCKSQEEWYKLAKPYLED